MDCIKARENIENIFIIHDKLILYSDIITADNLDKQITRIQKLGINIFMLNHMSAECALLSFKKLDSWLRLSGDKKKLCELISKHIYSDWIDYCVQLIQKMGTNETIEHLTFELLNHLCIDAPGNFRYSKGEIQNCWYEDCKPIKRVINTADGKQLVCDKCNINGYTSKNKIEELYKDSLLNNWSRIGK